MDPDVALTYEEEESSVGTCREGELNSLKDAVAFPIPSADGVNVVQPWAKHGFSFVGRGVHSNSPKAILHDGYPFRELVLELNQFVFFQPPHRLACGISAA